MVIEIQLLDLATGHNLVLCRYRKRGQTLADAALNCADDLVAFPQ